MASKPPDTALHIALTEAPDAAQGVSLVAKAQGIIIRDKASHEACREFLKGAKALKRSIEDHYAAIKKPLNEARNTVLDMEKRHLAPVLQAIATAEKFDTEYVREQRRIEEETARLERERLEREEQARRDKEAAAAEAAALKLEAGSNVLSEREQKFVAKAVAGRMTIPELVYAAIVAGYKSPEQAVGRLMKSDKINTAIANAIKAQRIREEAAANAAKPILVDVPKVESQIGSVSGTRTVTYYSCESFDTKLALRHLAERYEHGDPMLRAEIERYIGPALQTLLNAQARQLKTMFTQVWPGAKLGTRDGVAG